MRHKLLLREGPASRPRFSAVCVFWGRNTVPDSKRCLINLTKASKSLHRIVHLHCTQPQPQFRLLLGQRYDWCLLKSPQYPSKNLHRIDHSHCPQPQPRFRLPLSQRYDNCLLKSPQYPSKSLRRIDHSNFSQPQPRFRLRYGREKAVSFRPLPPHTSFCCLHSRRTFTQNSG